MASAQYAIGDLGRHTESPRPRGRENANGILCRNVTLFGYCRNEKSCEFVHDPARFADELIRDRFNVNSPSFVPLKSTTNSRTHVSPKSAVNAPVFTPKSTGQTGHAFSSPSQQARPAEWTGAVFQPFAPPSAPPFGPSDTEQAHGNAPAGPAPYDPFTGPMAAMSAGPSAHPVVPFAADSSGTTFYHDAGSSFPTPLRYHLYAPAVPITTPLPPNLRATQDFFIPDSLREELQRKAEATLHYVAPSAVPAKVDHFHSLISIEPAKPTASTVFGLVSWLYKAVSFKDGKVYLLRRFENFNVHKEQAIHSVHAWKRVHNSAVVAIHDAFTTRAFGDTSLVFVLDYYPLSKSLAELYGSAQPRLTGARLAEPPVPETVIWAYVVQIGLALKAIHSAGLACRSIVPSKLIVTAKNQVRMSGCGVFDVLDFDESRPQHELQVRDFLQFGRLIVGLCVQEQVDTDVSGQLNTLSRLYSDQLHDAVLWLLGRGVDPTRSDRGQGRDIDDFLVKITDRIAAAYESVRQADDAKTAILSKELENGRLVRLLCKLGLINERPEFAHDPSWSETGDRYCLKLFRDYVFHQVDSAGRPQMNLGHIIASLNKLDVGIDEKVQLTSRDEQNVLVVSYFELKHCLEAAFKELVQANQAGR